MARRLAAVLAVVSILVLGCSTGDGDPTARPRTGSLSATRGEAGPPSGPVVPATPLPAPEDPVVPVDGRPYRGYPDTVAVLGGSGATARGSGRTGPAYDDRASSWATGSEPQVASVYLRLVARHPEADGHAIDLSRRRASVSDLRGQARSLVALQPPAALVVVQPGGGDLSCPPGRADLDGFEEGLRAALDEIDDGLPTARIFVVAGVGGHAGCPAARSYEGRVEHACAALERCTEDGGALAAAALRSPAVASRGHRSDRGPAAVAAVAWRRMRAAGLLPAG